MYKSYIAYAGKYPNNPESVDKVLEGINSREELIVSVTAVGQDVFRVLIITQLPDPLEMHILEGHVDFDDEALIAKVLKRLKDADAKRANDA